MSLRRAMHLLLPLIALSAASGCARWEPQTTGLAKFDRACPLKRAPAIGDFGDTGVKGVYQFIIQDAPKEDLAAFLEATGNKSFSVAMMPMEINGMTALFAQGPGVLRQQSAADAEFDVACGIGHGKIYLAHVRYDSYEPEKSGWIRVH